MNQRDLMLQAQLDCETSVAKNRAKTNMQHELIEHRAIRDAELMDKKIEKLANMNLRLDETTYRVLRDSEENLMFEKVILNADLQFERYILKPATNVKKLKLDILMCRMPDGKCGELFAIMWENCTRPVIIEKHNASVDFIVSALNSAGCTIYGSRRHKKENAENVVAFLVNERRSCGIPYRKGWNRMFDGTWIFAKNAKFTYVEMIKNADD